MAELITDKFMECLLKKLNLKLVNKVKKIYEYAVLDPITPSLVARYTKIVNASNLFTSKYIC